MQRIEPIYLDHHATTPIDRRVLDEMMPFLLDDFGNPHSVDHILGWRASQAVDLAATRIAMLLGKDPDEIAFTSGATEANNWALLGIARGRRGANRKRILVSAIEHKCILAASRALNEREGFSVELVPVLSSGELDLNRLEELLPGTLMLSVMAVNNEIGTIQPLETVGQLCRRHDVLLHTDAAQAACAMDLREVADIADIVSLSAHKMYGPKGIGAAFIRRDLQHDIEPLIYGGGQQRGLRSGTLPTPLCVGMGAAARLISESGNNERKAIAELRDLFIAKLKELHIGIKLVGPPLAVRHPGNVNLQLRGINAQHFLSMLQPKLAASTGAACTSGFPEPSHVLRAIGLTSDEAESSIRFGIGRQTTKDDILTAVKIIEGAVHQLYAVEDLDDNEDEIA